MVLHFTADDAEFREDCLLGRLMEVAPKCIEEWFLPLDKSCLQSLQLLLAEAIVKCDVACEVFALGIYDALYLIYRGV